MIALHRFLLGLDSPREFRDWLYQNFEQLEPHLSREDFLALLELDYDDPRRIHELLASLSYRVVPLPPVDDPDELADHLVLADRLQAEGDPRGELILLQANLHSSGLLAVGETELLERHRDALLGPLAAWVDRDVLRLDWHMGFIARATLLIRDDDQDFGAIVRALLAHPSGQRLRELRAEREVYRAGWHSFRSITEVLAEVPSRITTLVLETNDEALWLELGDLGPLSKMQGDLRCVDLSGRCEILGAIPPKTMSFILRTRRLPRAGAGELVSSRAPLLERLELWSGDESDVEPSELAPLFCREKLPKLRHLSLPAAFHLDQLADVLLASDLLEGLTTLDLSRGNLSELGARRLIDRAPSLRHLRRLDLRWNDLPEPIANELSRVFPRALVREQFSTGEMRRLDLRGDPWR